MTKLILITKTATGYVLSNAQSITAASESLMIIETTRHINGDMSIVLWKRNIGSLKGGAGQFPLSTTSSSVTDCEQAQNMHTLENICCGMVSPVSKKVS